MWYTIKRLSLGVFLIGLASAILLVADWKGRSAPQANLPRVAIFQFSSRPLLDECVAGGIEGLAQAGFVSGQTIQIQKFNAENDLPTANSVAKTIVDQGFDLVLTFSTPCLQVMASANQDGKLIHVFGAVTDPFSAGVGINRDNPVDHPKHLAGIGTFQPVREIFQLAKALYPGLKSVGEVWCPAEACSEACTLAAREECKKLGIQLVEAQVDASAGVLEAAQSLTQRGAQALWVGGDNTVEMAVTSLINAAQQAKVPFFANTPQHVESGALFGLGADYFQVGQITGELATQVLKGLDPASVAIRDVMPQELAVNLSVLKTLRDPWKIDQATLQRAVTVLDERGVKIKQKALPTQEKPLAKKWKIHFLNFAEGTNVEEAHQGFFEEFKKLGMVEGRDYDMKVSNAQGDMATVTALIDAALSDQADLILLTSTAMLQATVQKVKDIPVVFMNVANPVLAGAGESETKHQANVTGISTMSDYEGMAQVVQECLPQAQRLGTLFNPNEINSVYNKDSTTAALKKRGIELVAVATSTSSEVADAALSLAAMDIDGICQVASQLHDAAFSGVAQAARKAKKPLFTFMRGLVADGGAVAVSRDYVQAGRDGANLAVRVMRGEDPAKIPFQPVSRTEIVVHLKNAAQCGLTIPASLLKRADEVMDN